ncbi:MAG: peptide chain release factor 2 [Candidatus Hydrogenedentota bacterium]|nr:MAG: peptide chain release factor 2 [Candidatus Hydrogenedentota bacterium]
MKRRLAELKKASEEPALWNDPAAAAKTMKELNAVRSKVDVFEEYSRRLDDLSELSRMAIEEGEQGILSECEAEIRSLSEAIEKSLVEASFHEDYDQNNAILSIHPGAGGTESCDWAAMLYRMYLRWAEASGYVTEELDRLPGEEAGIKSVTFLVKGPYGYGKLRGEAGVHRLVRISPFDASARRHTSFASVEVMPEVEDEVTVEIRDEDLKIDTYRSSGAGGQHVNVTDSAVRITHLPTGIVVTCQKERSQIKNRATAMKILRSRIYERMIRERAETLQEIQGEKKEIAWGSQIRSYVLQPYTLVKDHRTNVERGDVQRVLDGDLDAFINATVQWRLRGGEG